MYIHTYLRVYGLSENGADRVLMSGEAVHLHLGAHVPDAANAVSAASHEQVQRRVHCYRVHAGEVAVVASDDLDAKGAEAQEEQGMWHKCPPFHTLFCSRSQHLTCLSRPQENMYGCRGLITRPVTCRPN